MMREAAEWAFVCIAATALKLSGAPIPVLSFYENTDGVTRQNVQSHVRGHSYEHKVLSLAEAKRPISYANYPDEAIAEAYDL